MRPTPKMECSITHLEISNQSWMITEVRLWDKSSRISVWSRLKIQPGSLSLTLRCTNQQLMRRLTNKKLSWNQWTSGSPCTTMLLGRTKLSITAGRMQCTVARWCTWPRASMSVAQIAFPNNRSRTSRCISLVTVHSTTRIACNIKIRTGSWPSSDNLISPNSKSLKSRQ